MSRPFTATIRGRYLQTLAFSTARMEVSSFRLTRSRPSFSSRRHEPSWLAYSRGRSWCDSKFPYPTVSFRLCAKRLISWSASFLWRRPSTGFSRARNSMERAAELPLSTRPGCPGRRPPKARRFRGRLRGSAAKQELADFDRTFQSPEWGGEIESGCQRSSSDLAHSVFSGRSWLFQHNSNSITLPAVEPCRGKLQESIPASSTGFPPWNRREDPQLRRVTNKSCARLASSRACSGVRKTKASSSSFLVPLEVPNAAGNRGRAPCQPQEDPAVQVRRCGLRNFKALLENHVPFDQGNF